MSGDIHEAVRESLRKFSAVTVEAKMDILGRSERKQFWSFHLMPDETWQEFLAIRGTELDFLRPEDWDELVQYRSSEEFEARRRYEFRFFQAGLAPNDLEEIEDAILEEVELLRTSPRVKTGGEHDPISLAHSLEVQLGELKQAVQDGRVRDIARIAFSLGTDWQLRQVERCGANVEYLQDAFWDQSQRQAGRRRGKSKVSEAMLDEVSRLIEAGHSKYDACTTVAADERLNADTESSVSQIDREWRKRRSDDYRKYTESRSAKPGSA